MKKSENGFSIIEILILVVIIAIIGFVGWYVWSRHGASNGKSQTTAQSQSTHSTASISQNNSRLDIKEWGVTATIPSELGATSYTLSNNNIYGANSGSNSAATLHSALQKRLIPGNVFCSDSQNPWLIQRLTTTIYQEVNDTSDPGKVITIGSYVYVLAWPQTGCDNVSNDSYNQIDLAYTKLLASLKAN